MSHNCNTNCKGCILLSFKNEALNPNEYDLIRKSRKELIFKKGETIVKQGAFIDEVFFIQDGLVKLERKEENGRNMIVDVVSSNNHVGLAVLDSDDAPFSIIALKETKACLLRSTIIKYLVKTYVECNDFLIDWYKQNTLKQYKHLYLLGTRQMYGRLASSLLYFSNGNFKNSNVYDYLTRKDLANFSSMSVERMNHIIAELKNDNLISVDGKGFVINDSDKLKQLIKNN